MEHFRWQLTTSGSGRIVSAIPAWCDHGRTEFHLGNIGSYSGYGAENWRGLTGHTWLSDKQLRGERAGPWLDRVQLGAVVAHPYAVGEIPVVDQQT